MKEVHFPPSKIVVSTLLTMLEIASFTFQLFYDISWILWNKWIFKYAAKMIRFGQDNSTRRSWIYCFFSAWTFHLLLQHEIHLFNTGITYIVDGEHEQVRGNLREIDKMKQNVCKINGLYIRKTNFYALYTIETKIFRK